MDHRRNFRIVLTDGRAAAGDRRTHLHLRRTHRRCAAARGHGAGSRLSVDRVLFSARRPSRDGVPPRPGRSPRCDSSWHPPRDRLSALRACRESGKKYRHREDERPCNSAQTLLAADCDLEGRFRLASRQSGLLLGTDSDIRGVGSVLLPYIHRVAGRRSDGGEADEMLTSVTAAVGAETAKSGQDKQERVIRRVLFGFRHGHSVFSTSPRCPCTNGHHRPCPRNHSRPSRSRASG